MVVGGETLESVFKPIEAKRLSQTVSIVTDDGTLGEQGGVLDALPDAVERSGAEVVYAAARPATLRRVAELLPRAATPCAGRDRRAHGVRVRSLPYLRRSGGSSRRGGYDNLRSCVDGPVFNPARVLWDRWLSEEPRMLPTPPEGLPVVRSWPGTGEGAWRA